LINSEFKPFIISREGISNLTVIGSRVLLVNQKISQRGKDDVAAYPVIMSLQCPSYFRHGLKP